MATTTNFGWETPDDTDLVKDGAAAIRTSLNGVDSSFVDLKGGTTGQVLSKASGTDLDFTWVAQDDSNAIQNAIVDAKGDLIAASAADTPARLAVGTNGQLLAANSSASTGLEWVDAPSSGGMTLISTTTLTGSSVTLSSIPQTYKNLYVLVKDYLPATNNVALRMRFNGDSTANRHYQTYSYGAVIFAFDVTNVALAGNSDEVIPSELTVVNLYDYANTGTMKIGDNLGVDRETDGSTFRYTRTHFAYNQTNAITSLQFYNTSGNFTSGTILLYGVK